MSGQDQLSPAAAYAAAKARAKHSVTQEFIDSFDFGFDDFQIAACQAVEDGKGFDSLLGQVMEQGDDNCPTMQDSQYPPQHQRGRLSY
jgi:hypothetical protein